MAPTSTFPFNICADKEQNPAEQWQNLHPHHFHPHNCLHCDHLNHHYCIIITYQHHLGIAGIFLPFLKEAQFLIQSSLNSSNIILKIDFLPYSRDVIIFKSNFCCQIQAPSSHQVPSGSYSFPIHSFQRYQVSCMSLIPCLTDKMAAKTALMISRVFLSTVAPTI